MAAALRVGSDGDGDGGGFSRPDLAAAAASRDESDDDDGGGFPRWIGWLRRRWLLPTANPAAPTAPVATRMQIRRRQQLLAPEI
uniref:DUF834 domain-containing protein n=1 Tax=Oryza meridionalis TaxID=40149 RepID=A0A0E0DU86_9ORYZ